MNMFLHYFVIAWRQLRKNALYSGINILGLAAGLSICILILLFVVHEHSYDSFHKNASHIYVVESGSEIDGRIVKGPSMSYTTGPILQRSQPGVIGFTRVYRPWPDAVVSDPENGESKFTEKKILFADSNFFSFFNFKLMSGHPAKVLAQPFSAVLSKGAALKYFGRENPVGKMLRYNDKYNLRIAGVAVDAPTYSSIQFDIMVSMASMQVMEQEKSFVNTPSGIQAGAFSNYIVVSDERSINSINNYLKNISKPDGYSGDSFYTTTRLTDFHLQSITVDRSGTHYLGLFVIVAALILLLALTNYLSLSTARAATRAKEVGVRKYMGARRRSIAWQFMVESVVYTSIAFALAYLLCYCLQPFFFTYVDIRIDHDFLYHPFTLMTYAGLYLLTIVLAGFYPSLILSAFEPIKAVTGKLSMSGSGLTVRQCITVFQFVISVILILFSIAIKEQMKFMTRFNTGIRKENVIMIPFNNSIGNHYAALKKEVGRMASVQGVTTARYELYEGNYDALLVNVDGKPGSFALPIMNVDADFIEVMGLKWILPPHDSVYQKKKNIVAVNPAAISKLHLPDDPRNYRMPFSFSDVYITGVLSNFHFSSLHYPVDPMCIFINQDTTNIWSEFGTMYVRFNDREGIHAGVPQIKKIYEQFVSNAPFEYAFLDDAYLSRYKAERKLAAISSVFTVVTVLISCLGLFGLITFNTHKRTKEMGVRKVLGASVEDIAVLLSRDLIKLVMIAMLISCPVAWYVMDRWLQNYAYRVQISVWFFAVTIVAVMLLAVLSTCVQAVRAAVANPVKSLRTE